MALIKIPVFFQDLGESTRYRILEAVRYALSAELPREEGETDADYERRLDEEADDYVNRHNLATEFAL